jgi:hypothetical protein
MVGGQELNNARRSAGEWGWHTHNQLAKVHRVETINIFFWPHAQQGGCLIKACGKWKLDEIGVNVGIFVKGVNRFIKIALTRIYRQFHVMGVDANFCAVGMLHRYITLTGCILTHQDCSQANRDPFGSQASHAVAKLHPHSRGKFFAV